MLDRFILYDEGFNANEGYPIKEIINLNTGDKKYMGSNKLNFVIMRNNTTCLPDAALLRYLARLSAVEHVSAKPDDLAAAAALKLDKGGLLEKSTGSDCVSDLDLPEGLAAEGEVTDFE